MRKNQKNECLIANVIRSLLLLLMVCTLTNVAVAQTGAPAIFSSLSLPPTTMDAADGVYGQIHVSGYVKAPSYGDAVSSVELLGKASYDEKSFPFVMSDDSESPRNVSQYFDLTASLPTGVNELFLRTHYFNRPYADAPIFKVTVNGPPAKNSAGYLSQSIPSQMVAGQVYRISIAMTNTGTSLWEPGLYLLGGLNDDTTWKQRVALPNGVPPGQSITFYFDVTAPAQPGTYSARWRMVQEQVEWFGGTTPATIINVVSSDPAVPTASISTPQMNDHFMAIGTQALIRVKGTAQSSSGTTLKTLKLMEGNAVLKESPDPAVFDMNVQLSTGPHKIYLLASDGVRESSHAEISIVIDPPIISTGPAPTVSLTSIVDGQLYRSNGTGATLPIIGTASGSQAIKKIELFDKKAGASTAVLLKGINSSNVNFEQLFEVGTHAVELRATDVGDVAGSVFASFEVVSPPTVTLISPADGATISSPTGASVPVAISATMVKKGGATIQKIEIIDNQMTIGAISPTGLDLTGATPFSSVVQLAPGTHALMLLVWDNVGNIIGSSSVTVTIKPPVTNTAPTVNLTTPNNGAQFVIATGKTIEISVVGSAIDAEGGIDLMDLLDNDVVIATGAGASFNSTVFLVAGSHKLQLRAKDKQGLTALSPASNVGVSAAKTLPFAELKLYGMSAASPNFLVDRGGLFAVYISGQGGAAGAAIVRTELHDGSTILASYNADQFKQLFYLPAGLHPLQVWAIDADGAVGVSKVTNFHVSMSSDDVVYWDAINVPIPPAVGSASDFSSFSIGYGVHSSPGSAISKIELRDADTNGLIGVQSFPIRHDSSYHTIDDPRSGSFNVNLSGGYHRLFFRAYDDHLNSGDNEFAVTVPVTTNKLPVAQFISPISNSIFLAPSSGVANVNFEGVSTDADGPVTTLELLDQSVFPYFVTGVYDSTISVKVPLAIGTHHMQLRATDGQKSTGLSVVTDVTVIAQKSGNAAQFISQNVPSIMQVGQAYSATVSMLNTGSTTWTPDIYWLASPIQQDGVRWNGTARALLNGPVVPGQVGVFTVEMTAPNTIGTFNFQWQMRKDGAIWFGDKSASADVAVIYVRKPTATLNAQSNNVRVAMSQTAAVTFTGTGVELGGVVKKLELFQDSMDAAGGGSKIVWSLATGNTASMAMNVSLNLPAGTYTFKLRATDNQGTYTDSSPIPVNVTDSLLLGTVAGVRINAASIPELVGWACQPGSMIPLSYQLLLDAPTTAAGGTPLTSGTANNATEPDNGAIQSLCGSAGVGHHFVINLASFTAQYPGRALYVRMTDSSWTYSTTLPCSDNSCTVPGSLRIALSTPSNGLSLDSASQVFMRAVLSGGSGPYDEVSLGVDGVWTPANPDGALDAFSVTSPLLASRAAPYAIQARVRQGNITLYSMVSMVTVRESLGMSVMLLSPANGATATSGVPVNLSAIIPGDSSSVISVKFYANGQLVANGISNGSTWKASWNNVPAGTYNVTAAAFDGDGIQLGRSVVSSMTVSSGGGGSGDTPGPITVTVDQLSNGEGGALPGGVSVSNDGSAGYSVPVKLPPGILGMAPEISLSYDSNTPSGLAGLGWTLGGIAHIDRCGKIAATDGRSDGVRFSSYIGTPGVFGPYANQPADRLCLQGQRLILVNGNSANDADYWADGAIYRTEVETFTRVTAFVSNGRRAFKAEGRNGRTSYFGDTDDSYIEAQGRADGLAYRWYQSRSTDRSGNYISYSYNEDTATGEHNPASISWGGNTQQGTPHFAKVEFGYELRKDPRTSYIAGSQISETKRLASIKTSVIASDDSSGAFATALTYSLAYQISPTSGRSLLYSIRACDGGGDCAPANECDADGKCPATLPTCPAGSHCLPPTIFSWGKPDPAAKKEFAALGGVRSGPDLFALVDYNPIGNRYVNTAMDSIVAADFNGDGKTDILERYRVAANGFKQRLYTSNASGTDWTVSTPLAAVGFNTAIMETGDFDGDGLPDLLVVNEDTSTLALCLSSRRSGGNYVCDLPVTGIPAEAFGGQQVGVPYRIVKDYNADGKDDLALRSDNSEQRRAFQCLSTGTDFNCIEVTATSDEPFFGDRPGETGTLLSTDVDGDGRVDSILLSKCRWDIPSDETRNRWVCGSSYFGPDAGGLTVFGQGERGAASTSGSWYQFPNKKTQILSQSSFGTMGSDLNADGYTDLVFGSVDLSTITSVQNPVFSSTICYSRGNGKGECRTLPASNHVNGVNRDHLVMTLGDFDGDGIYDVLRPLNDTWEETNVSGYQVCRIGTDTSLGADPLYQRCDAWSGPTFYSQPGILLDDAGNDQGFTANRSMFLGDFDGDGKQDIVVYQPGGQWQVYGAANQAMANQALDKLVSVKNGMGREERVEYSLSNDSSIYQSTVSRDDGLNTEGRLTYPGRPLVKALHADDGAAGVRDTTYRYFRQASDKSGRGSLGFAQVERTDVQRGVVTTSAPCLSFPTIGMDCLSKEVTTAGIVLSSSATTWASLPFTHASGGKTVMPYVSSATVVRKDPDGKDLGKTETTTTTLDSWGNVLDTKTVSSSLDNPTGFSVRKVMAYQNDEPTWRLGEMTSSTETRSNSYGSASRQSTYSYDAQGLPASESRVSTDNAQALTTTYDRTGTGFGLVGKTILKWTDAGGALATRTVSDVGYTANGRFVKTVKNALSQQEGRTFDARTGQATSVTSVNGLTSYAGYDGFGRQRTATGVDGIVAGTSYRNCAANCPAGAAGVIVQEMKDGNGARVAVPTLQFIDNAGRAIRTVTWGFDGRKIASDVAYDVLGRIKTAYWPRYVAAGGELDATPANARIRATTLYDVLDRVLSVQTADEAGQPQTTTYQWVGYQRTTTNPKGQSIVELKDVWGKLVWTQDANQKRTQFAFDAFGNLRQTTDSLNNVVTVTFDGWGRRTDLKDPDLGWIHYQVDPLGQVLSQVSPNQRPSKSTVMTYDVLGRMTGRVAEGLTAGWTYDKLDGQADCATYKSCGQLVESFTKNGDSKDYQQLHTYEAKGRPETTTTYLDKTYTSKIGYDTWGRVVRETAQRGSDAAKVYERRYNAYGQLERIERGATVVWKATQQDALGQVTSATLGNGFVAGRSYDLNTGRLSGATLVDAQGASRLKEDYAYDALGNVSQRTQAWGAVSFIESFDYDSLNRLKSAAILGYAQQDFTYDDIGNIVSKTGTGSGNYVYPASGVSTYSASGASSARPHAVSSIPSLGSFVYDDNGNMTSGAGRTVTWNSFDMPVEITKGMEKCTFYYGPDHQRIRQVRADGITTYYAGAMEVEVTSMAETVKTYLPLGLGVEIDKAGVTQLSYMHRDRLGSVVGISGEAGGALLDPQAYDSWGKRRALATPATPDNIDGVIDNKGYTGHEMLDKLDLVHMNGRVYDPLVARFMSADPLIQDPTHSQSYNRYTYVWNNPTNLTDPTGFETDGKPEVNAGQSDSGCDKRCQQLKAIVDKICMGYCPGRSQSSSKDNTGGAGNNSPRSISANNNGNGVKDPCAGKEGCVWVPGKRDTSLPVTPADREVMHFAAIAANGIPFERPFIWGYKAYQSWRAARLIRNAIPLRAARVVPAEFVNGSRLAGPGANEAWVTAAEDLKGISDSSALSSRLTLVDKSGNLLPGPYGVIEFDLPASGVASPILRDNPGFVSPGTGLTAGGAREFVIPNYEIGALKNVTTRIVP
jgi:RHS repeat-associated protein